jgi:chromosome segregation ATPase
MSTAQAVIEAEANLKHARAERDKEERKEWTQKVKEIAKEARQVKAEFDAAKEEFAHAVNEQHKLNRQSMQITADLRALEELYKSIEFPLEEETQEYELRKKKLNAKREALRGPSDDLAHLQGQARARQVPLAARYQQLQYAYRNAKTRAEGRKPGIEGGVYFVTE